ncbi:radical SAM family heme chaperone HemW [Acidiferrimicrobium sp. IK]|uniref:radical SAM family heme chaperone HemW n=1 Tax=Acidiferrimicrobium sp. IK TaxID=2871700 RepID=UPI0021CB55DB|nr:radical SAM family heme chaperone HemW [Acidiferrimicrobium sp. IK]MCU4183911.1 radical SAM family heme chaperone HemW [Acidiferrimicrobium sp. IK]
MASPIPSPGFGVYVHVPFCSRRCDYCAFATWTDRHHLMGDYAAACVAEIARATSAGELDAATSVFFGGGTPSLLPAEELAAILAAIAKAPGAEVTVECNPETVTAELLACYRSAGVTRLSFGVQSMAPHVLASLGREHDPAAVTRAVALAGDAGYGDSYSVDLILGAAGESIADWEATLAAVLALDPAPAHVSAYSLTVEPGTPLAKDPQRAPDPDDQADKYLLADQVLSDAGLSWYEVSNWSRPGAECRHNQLYWTQGPYRGIGCAAHSHALVAGGGSRRWWNVRTPDRYINLVSTGASTVAASESLPATARALEALQLSLRTAAGVPADALPSAEEDPALEDLVVYAGGRAVLTPAGRLLANEVSLRLRDPAASR